MAEQLAPSSPVDADLRAALPLASPALTVRVVEGLYVLALRHLAGGTSAVEAALATHNLIPLPAPGSFHGTDPWLLWTGPSESLLLTSKGALAVGVLQALAPGRELMACALDQSAGCLVFELLGTGVADVLSSLLDASAVPRQSGKVTRARLWTLPRWSCAGTLIASGFWSTEAMATTHRSGSPTRCEQLRCRCSGRCAAWMKTASIPCVRADP